MNRRGRASCSGVTGVEYPAATFGALAAASGVVGTVPYMRDTLRGRTRPHRGAWLVWSVLAVVAYLSQRADGGSWSVMMCGVQAVMNALVFALAVRYGTGGVTASDGVLLAVAAAGLAGWAVIDDPVVATACVVAADGIGIAMIVPKSWCDPDSETLSTFALASLGGALALGAAGTGTASLLLYPIYYCLANGAIAVILRHRRGRRPASEAGAAPAAPG
jgi:hypothetical protein